LRSCRPLFLRPTARQHGAESTAQHGEAAPSGKPPPLRPARFGRLRSPSGARSCAPFSSATRIKFPAVLRDLPLSIAPERPRPIRVRSIAKGLGSRQSGLAPVETDQAKQGCAPGRSLEKRFPTSEGLSQSNWHPHLCSR